MDRGGDSDSGINRACSGWYPDSAHRFAAVCPGPIPWPAGDGAHIRLGRPLGRSPPFPPSPVPGSIGVVPTPSQSGTGVSSVTPTLTLTSLVFPGLKFAPRAQQRLNHPPPEDHPRPGMPSLHALRAEASGAALTTEVAAATHLAAGILAPWPKEVTGRPDTFADRLFVHFQDIHSTVGLELHLSMILWMAARLRSADASSVLRYSLLIRPHVALAYADDPFAHPIVKRFRQRMMALRGRHRQAFRPTICVSEYHTVIADITVPASIRAVILLAWRRAARVADILETRCGGLWVPERGPEALADTLWLEQPFAKTQQTGSWDRLLISITMAERAILDSLNLICPLAPQTPPQRRPLMFPHILTSSVAEALAGSLGRKVGAHSLRRSALLTAVEAGVPLAEAVLLSLHSSVASAAAYVLRPDLHVAATMATVSRSTTAPPRE
jgi:hypothetical protein